MTDETSPDDRLTVREVAAILGRSIDHVRTLIYSNALPGELDLGDRNYRVLRRDVEHYRAGQLHTEPDPMFAELDDYHRRIKAARQLVSDLLEERNRAMLRWVDVEGRSVTAAAKAAHMGRQQADTALKVTRAKVPAPHDD